MRSCRRRLVGSASWSTCPRCSPTRTCAAATARRRSTGPGTTSAAATCSPAPTTSTPTATSTSAARSRGSTSAPYAVNLSVGVDGEGVWVFGRCSCPVHEGCKHALALLITVRDEHGRDRAAATAAAGSASCPRCSTSSTTGADRGSQRAPSRPLALQVDLQAAGPVDRLPRLVAGGDDRRRPGHAAAAAAAARRPRQLGPHRHLLDRRALPRPRAATRATRSPRSTTCCPAHRAATRQMYFGADAHLSLGGFGPDEVAPAAPRGRRRDAARAPAPGSRTVELADPVDPAARRERRARRRTPGCGSGSRLDEEWYAAGRPRRARRGRARGRAVAGRRRRAGR